MAGAPKQTLVIDMTDEVSGPAGNAADALERLKQKIVEDVAALRDLQAAQGRLKGSTVDVVKQKEMLQDKIQSLKNSVASNQGQYLRMGGSLKDLSTKTKETGGALSQATEGLQSMSASIGKVAGVIGIAVMVAAAVFRAAHAMASFVVSSLDAARTTRLTAEAMTGSAENAKALELHIASLSRWLPQTRAELMKMAQGLHAGGLAGNLLVATLRGVAIAEAALPGAGAKIQSIAEAAVRAKRFMVNALDLQGSGVSVGDVAGQLAKQLKVGIDQAKQALVNGKVTLSSGLKALYAAVEKVHGKTAAMKGLGFEVQIERAKELFATIFSKLDFEPFLQAFHEVVSLFDETTSSGKMIRTLMGSLFGGMGGSVKGVAGIVRGFIEGLLIGAALIRIAYLSVKLALLKAIPRSLRPDVDMVTAAMYAGVGVVGLLTLAFLGLATVISGPLLVAFGPILAIAAVSYGVYLLVKKFGVGIKSALSSAVDWIAGKVEAAFEAVKAFNPFSIGFELIKNFGDGILSGITGLLNSITGSGENIAETLSDAFKKKNEQHSPSRVGIRLGATFTRSVAMGVESEKDHLDRRAYDVFPVLDGEAKAAGAASGGGTASAQPLVVHAVFNGMAQNDRTWFRKELDNALREIVNTAGLVPSGAA